MPNINPMTYFLLGTFLTIPIYFLSGTKFNDYKEYIEDLGYRLEEIDVTTEDGYIINLWHLIPNFNVSPDKVFFLQHGFASTGEIYFEQGEHSLPKLLMDKGYDVWIGNYRGEKNSQKHVSKNSKKTNGDYWDYSIDDIVKYDLQTQINYIKNKTKAEKVDYLGLSEGATLFLMLYMDYPDFVESSINRFISFGVVRTLTNLHDDIIDVLSGVYKFFKVKEKFDKTLQVKDSVRAAYINYSKKNEDLKKQLFSNFGVISNKTDMKSMHHFLTYFPTDISIYHLYQWKAIQEEGKLVHYNPRVKDNQFQEYDLNVLKKWKIKAFITRSKVDSFSGYEEVTDLYNLIENKSLITLFDCDYSHLDFLGSEYSYDEIYIPIMKFLDEN